MTTPRECDIIRMRNKQKLSYLRWYEVPTETVTLEEFEKVLSSLEKNGQKATSKTRVDSWIADEAPCYAADIKGKFAHIYLVDMCQPRHIQVNLWGEKPEIIENEGTKAKIIVNEMFLEKWGKTPRQAFGYSPREINRCVPKSFYYVNENYKNKVLHHVSKADVSSAYPYQLKGRLPDWNTAIRVEGYVEPFAEFPFAFYKSGHSAELGVYDTRSWLGTPYGERMLKHSSLIPCSPEEEVTYLCQATDNKFDEIMEYLYRNRGVEALADRRERFTLPAKRVMNSYIGTMHTNEKNQKRPTNSGLFHVSAVCLCRHNQRMLNIITETVCPILQVIVDTIIYKSPARIGCEGKKFGALVQEYTDCDFIMRGQSQYIFQKNGETVFYRSQGLDSEIKVERLEDIYFWKRSANIPKQKDLLERIRRGMINDS